MQKLIDQARDRLVKSLGIKMPSIIEMLEIPTSSKWSRGNQFNI